MKSFRCLFDMSDLDIGRVYYSINIYKYRFLDSLSVEETEYFTLLLNRKNADCIRRKYPQFRYIVYDDCWLVTLLGRFPNRQQRLIDWLYRYRINFSGCQVFFSASNIDIRLTWKINIPKVVVVHDIKSLWERQGEPDGEAHRKWMQSYYYGIIESSYRTIAISQYTKDNLINNLPGIDQSKLKVIYNSVQLSERSEAPSGIGSRKYILYVNTLSRYKNIGTLIEAYLGIMSNREEDLVIVGSSTSYWDETIVPRIGDYLSAGRIRHLENISNEELKYLYEHASLFVSPSLNEGFGYTPIEASICGCPVITSRCEALPDTTMDMVSYYYNPIDAKELSEKMIELLDNPPSQALLMKIAESFRTRYSAERQKKEIMKILFDDDETNYNN